jgi:hypothetical protein
MLNLGSHVLGDDGTQCLANALQNNTVSHVLSSFTAFLP